MHTDFYQTRDGARLRLAHWPAGGAARGRCLLLHGRSEFIEKYEETAERLAARGFEVWSFDWRGQGLSSRPAPHPQRCHIDDFATHVADLGEIAGRVAPDSELLLAHSLGGHIALRFLAERPNRIRAAVVCAPMIGIATLGLPPAMLGLWARRRVRMGQAQGYALGQQDFGAARYRRRRRRLTGDAARFAAQARHLADNPALCLGGVTWGWLDAAFRSAALLLEEAPRIATPVLMALAGRERIVSNAAARAVARRLPACTLRDYSEARHEILRETDAVQAAFWRDVDAFLADRGI